jgi:ketosteroid isomerase-like protein
LSPVSPGGGEAIDRLFAAFAKGDLAAAGDCLTDDVRVWHCFDRIAHDKAAILKDWEGLISGFPERAVIDVRRQATDTGFVQQHIMAVSRADGRKMAWPVCIVVTMRGELIATLDEYIDRAGYFTP